jgi:hypothetical protein
MVSTSQKKVFFFFQGRGAHLSQQKNNQRSFAQTDFRGHIHHGSSSRHFHLVESGLVDHERVARVAKFAALPTMESARGQVFGLHVSLIRERSPSHTKNNKKIAIYY